VGDREGDPANKFFADLVEEIVDHAELEIDRHFGAVIPPPLKPLPGKLRRVWRWFWDLSEARGYIYSTEPGRNDDGDFVWRAKKRASRISRTEIASWAASSGIVLEQWQLAAITLIDSIYVKAFNGETTTEQPPVGRKFSLRLFDALFGK
jgi:hypothetical protein